MRHLLYRCLGTVIAAWSFASASTLPAAEVAQTIPDSPNRALDNPLASFSLDRLQATRDRPLFAPSRRPPPLPVARQVVEPVVILPPPNMVLFGIVADHTGARAVLRSGGSGKVIPARIGDEIEGWKVTQIEPRRLVLTDHDRSVSFALFAGRDANGPATSGPTIMPAHVAAETPVQEMTDRRRRRE